MVDRITAAHDRLPGLHLVDNRFVTLDSIERSEARGVEIIAPVGGRGPFGR